jgi:hypothetical protein
MKTLTISLILMTLFAMHAYAAEYERRNFSGADRLPVFQDGDVFKWCNFSQPEPHTQIGYTVVEGTDPPQYRLAEKLTFQNCNLNNCDLPKDAVVKDSLVVHIANIAVATISNAEYLERQQEEEAARKAAEEAALQTDVGDAGAGLTAIGDTRLANLDAAVSTRSSHAAADIWSVEARTVTGGTVTAGTVSDKTGYSLSVTPPTASDIASAVWSAVTRTLTAFAFTPTPSNAADTTSIMAVTDKLDTMLEAKDGKYLYTSASVVNATSIDAAIVASIDNIEAIGNKLNDTLTDSGGGNYIFSEAALAEAPTGGGGDATAANQTTILADLAAIKGAAFSTTTDSLEAIRNRGDAAWTTSTVSEDKVAVNEDTGGTDNLRYMYNGQPISGATIRAYTKADYTAGTYTLRGKTTTNDEGRWTTPIYLDDGVAYTLVFNKHGEYGPTAVEVTP